MNLTGTIPVPYKGNIYNIPICLWLLDTYPYNPPICFVKPTSSMTIKTGKHVDANGKIYLPYLHEWKHPQSDLLGLIQVMIVVFGDEPQSSLVPLFQHLIHHTRQQGHQILPICQACQVESLHIHLDILPTPVVIQAVLTHLVVSILPQQVLSTLPSLLWPLLAPVGMAPSARTPSEPLSSQQSVTS